MAKISTAQRRRMKNSEFALPGHRFPLNDKSHDEAAIRDAPHALHAGTISKAQEQKIEREARAKLHRGNGDGGRHSDKGATSGEDHFAKVRSKHGE